MQKVKKNACGLFLDLRNRIYGFRIKKRKKKNILCGRKDAKFFFGFHGKISSKMVGLKRFFRQRVSSWLLSSLLGCTHSVYGVLS